MPRANAPRTGRSTSGGRRPGRPGRRQGRPRGLRAQERRGIVLTSSLGRHRVCEHSWHRKKYAPGPESRTIVHRMISRTLKPLLFVLAIVGVLSGVEAQRPDRVPRIGYLVISPLADPPSAERAAFLDGLRELGYVAGRNIVVEYRSAAWNRELLSDLAAELVDLKVDVIVAVPGTVEAARDATKTIPIVVPALFDPVDEGLVTSLARPGGNITGPGWSTGELNGKRLEVLKEAIPKLSRVAVLWNPTNQGAARQWHETQSAARKLR